MEFPAINPDFFKTVAFWAYVGAAIIGGIAYLVQRAEAKELKDRPIVAVFLTGALAGFVALLVTQPSTWTGYFLTVIVAGWGGSEYLKKRSEAAQGIEDSKKQSTANLHLLAENNAMANAMAQVKEEVAAARMDGAAVQTTAPTIGPAATALIETYRERIQNARTLDEISKVHAEAVAELNKVS